MSEIGFFHPSVGYWQTLGEPPEEILSSYPSGTVRVPIKPSEFHTFDGAAWVPPSRATLMAAYAENARSIRRAKLAESDWSQLPDVPSALREKWADYRQALRDISQQEGFPFDIEWPSMPEES
jgi:hypothetical protein